MARKHQCKCGHGKGEHATSYKGYDQDITYRHCMIKDCPCRLYVFDKYTSATKKGEALPRAFKRTRKVFTIKDCDENGIPF